VPITAIITKKHRKNNHSKAEYWFMVRMIIIKKINMGRTTYNGFILSKKFFS
jgi:hypothetical protein